MRIDKLTRESLAPYLPIPHGGRKFLALLLVTLAAVAGAFVGYRSHNETLEVISVGAIALIIILPFRDPKFGGRLTNWLAAFVERNVTGYELWCVRSLYGDATVTYEIHRRGDFVSTEGQKVVLVVPLRVGAWCGVRIPDTAGCWWSVRTHDIALDFHAGTIVVEMRDRSGDRFKVDVERALRILASERSTCQRDTLTQNVGSVGWLVDGLMARLDEANANLAAERTDRDLAVAALDEARGRIDATKRFSRSTDAMHIRDWLAQRVIAHVAFRDFPRHTREDAA